MSKRRKSGRARQLIRRGKWRKKGERKGKERQKSSLKRFMNSVCWSNRPQRHQRLGRLKSRADFLKNADDAATQEKVCVNATILFPAYLN